MQLNVYKNFFEDFKNDPDYLKYKAYKDDDFIIAAISSPSPSIKPDLANELSIYVYFSNLKKQIVLKKEYAWESLSRTHIGHVPLRELNEDGFSSIPWSEHRGKKSKAKHFVFDTNTFIGFIQFKDLDKHYDFKLWIHERPETQNIMDETIAVYEFDNKVVLIPSIVNIQAFYTKSKANSLFDALASPQGLALMVKRSGYEVDPKTKKNIYHVYATGNSHIADASMLTYYSYDQDISDMFNKCAMDIHLGKKVKAKIPKKGLIEFEADYFFKVSGKKILYLITSIQSSKLSNETILKIGEVKFHHPNAHKWVQSSKSTTSQKPRKNTPAKQELNDSTKVDSEETPFLAEANDMYMNSTGEIELVVDVVSPGERERGKSGNKPKVDKNKKAPSSRTPRGGSGEGKPVENKPILDKLEVLLETDDFGSSNNIIKELRSRALKVEYKTYKVPLLKGEEIGPSLCYRDKEKKQRRKFFVMKVSGIYMNNVVDFFYIDMEPKEDNTKKEILIIKSNKDFENMVMDTINIAIIDQVENGNRKWLKDREDILPKEEFLTLRHSKTGGIEDFVDRILMKVVA